MGLGKTCGWPRGSYLSLGAAFSGGAESWARTLASPWVLLLLELGDASMNLSLFSHLVPAMATSPFAFTSKVDYSYDHDSSFYSSSPESRAE